MVYPPSTITVAPVMNDESSEQRKATTAAISEGSPRRPIGTWTRCAGALACLVATEAIVSALWLFSPVATCPGHTQLARMPRSAYCTATARVRATTPALDGVVGGRVAAGDDGGDGADRHDAASSRLQQVGERMLDGQERSREVDSDDQLPLLQRHLVGHRRMQDPGAGDDRVQPAQLAGCVSDHSGRRGLVRNIVGERRRPAVVGGDPLSHLLGQVGSHVGDRHRCTFGGEAKGTGLADAAAGSRDERSAASQPRRGMLAPVHRAITAWRGARSKCAPSVGS